MGVLFNDWTRLILYNDGDSLQYIERDGTESYLTVNSHPGSLTKKVRAGWRCGRSRWVSAVPRLRSNSGLPDSD